MLNHIMIGDILWLNRFSKYPQGFKSLKNIGQFIIAGSLDQILYNDISTFFINRKMLDQTIVDFCDELTEENINTNLQYINFKKETHSKRFGYLVLHVFLHQIHHRGQVTALLSQQGIDFGDTDIPEIIAELG